MANKTRNIVVDVESDGPCPGMHSMICFGAVMVDGEFNRTFYAQLKPVSDIYIPEALAVSGFNREQTLNFPDPAVAMANFDNWIKQQVGDQRPVFWSDNNGYDFSFINHYFHHYLGQNPFGWSSGNINSLYKGLSGDLYGNIKHLADTKHTHHPVDDAKGAAQALYKMFKLIKNNNRD